MGGGVPSMASSRDHSNAADAAAREVHASRERVASMASTRCHAAAPRRRRPSFAIVRRSQKASDVKAEKEKMRPFEKARADLVKRNDKLDRDQVRGAASS